VKIVRLKMGHGDEHRVTCFAHRLIFHHRPSAGIPSDAKRYLVHGLHTVPVRLGLRAQTPRPNLALVAFRTPVNSSVVAFKLLKE
jgi:hypothetical protein